eukprot:GFKZ01011661.1.p1 GENE.GFKZ01011661.1~~GFKZ01011661.1.p1  ORF type:complete len:517 (-),score=33.40 GFKZ01011661.1:613-2163(-)
MGKLHQRRPTISTTPPVSYCSSARSKDAALKGKGKSSWQVLLKLRSDTAILIVFSILAFATRFYRLHLPPAVVFDELHFSKFTDRLLRHVWFFDIHPPLGKQILAYSSYVLGYRPDPNFVIEKIGNAYPPGVKYTIVRGISAAFSVATVPITYLISRRMHISKISSVLVTTSVLLDFLGLIEGRLILMDSQLLFFCQLSLYLALLLWETHHRTRKRSILLVLTGLASGAALSIKHTALATPGLIAIISFFGLHFLPLPLDIWECISAAISGLAVYVLSFYVMFKALWETGGKYDNFMPMSFKKTLVGGEHFDPEAKRRPFVRLFLYINARMISSNASIKKRHSWESDWYQWIVNWRGVLYYVKKETIDGTEKKQQIYLLGNPVVIYLTLLCVGIFIIILVVTVRYRQSSMIRSRIAGLSWKRNNGIFLLCGWLCNLLPYILVHRAAFIYHYMPGLFYGQLLSAVVFDFLPPKVRAVSVLFAVMGIVAAFVYWSPWVYGFPLTKQQHDARRWLPRWN